MRLVFFGSDDFAAVCLEELLKSSHEMLACVTQPDARQGRGMKLSLSPIKQIACDHDITCLQPENFKEPSAIETLKSFKADIFVVVAYGRILPESILNIPMFFCVNVHGSLLPQYRGAAPINWAIINGDKQTGVTIMKMNSKMDAGDIIAQEIIPLTDQITANVLRSQMAQIGAKLLVKTLDQISSGQYTTMVQDESKVSIASKLTKELGHIDWKLSAEQIERLIRGLKPWPGTYTMFKGKILKILQASVVEASGIAGTIIDVNKDGFVIACGQKSLLIKNVHLEASKAVTAYDFVQGHRLVVGQSLE